MAHNRNDALTQVSVQFAIVASMMRVQPTRCGLAATAASAPHQAQCVSSATACDSEQRLPAMAVHVLHTA